MDAVETSKPNLVELVDEGIKIDRLMKEQKKELDRIKADLTELAYEKIDNKAVKYIQIYGNEGHFNASYKEKFEIDNYDKLIEILADRAKSKIVRKEEIKYDPDTTFKAALIALCKGEYSNDISVEDVLTGLGFDQKKAKTLMKKLKGDYIKDKETLMANGAEGELEEELYAIKQYKNYELVQRFFGDLTADQIEEIRRAVWVEDSISVGFDYEK